MILSQLVDADELKALSPEELRNMILKLDDEVVYGSSEVLSPDKGPAPEAPEQAPPSDRDGTA